MLQTAPDLSALRASLATAVTRFDRKEEERAARNPRAYHNPYGLGIMLNRVDSVIADIATGTSVARALYDNFQDRLLTALERVTGNPVTYGGGSQDKGRPL